MAEKSKTKSASRPKIGRPIGRRPVLALRVHATVREKLENAAKSSQNTVAAEAERRIVQSFDWDRARQTVDAWKTKQQNLIAKELREALVAAGYQQVANASGRAWVEPGIDFDATGLSPEAIEEIIERAVSKALSRVHR